MPSPRFITSALNTFALLSLATLVMAQQQGKPEDQPSPQTPQYNPPMRGAPASRVGGGSRGIGNAATLAVIAPDHTGLTLQEQPTLYWYVSKKVPAHVEITVIDDSSIRPLLEKTLDTSVGPGIQSLRLKDYGVTLKPDVEYRWHIAIVVDPNQRSNDTIASGTIKRIVPSASMKEILSRDQDSASVAAYAKEGIWYDAIASLMNLMSASPSNDELQRQYGALLNQVGLGQISNMR